MKIRKLLAALTLTFALTGGAFAVFHSAPTAVLQADSDNAQTPDVG